MVNLIEIICSALPSILFLFIISLFLDGSIKRFKTLNHLLFGSLSICFVIMIYAMFPNWCNVLFIDHPYISIYFYAFIQVALLEEICKYASFKILDRLIYHNNTPVSTMFYCGVTSATFAAIENYSYIMKYGLDVIIIRGLSSVPMHMMCGLMMGYFISLGRYGIDKRFSKGAFTLIGILVGVTLHGFYDVNWMINSPSASIYNFILMILSVQLVRLQFKHLIEVNNVSQS